LYYINIFFIKLIDFFVYNRLVFVKGFKKGRGLKVKGNPNIKIVSSASIEVGDNVTLNSRNYGYHVNMHTPVKLMADKVDAIIKIGNNTRINGACLHAYNRIEVGSNCLIAANVQIFDANGHDICFENVSNRINTSDKGRPIIIEDNVWVGLNSIVLPGVTIGQGSVIAANTVVSKNVPPMVVFAGNPGKVVKKAVRND